MAMASASVSKRKIGASGPKVSSRATIISEVTSPSTVGSKKLPPKACGWPPASTLAPLLTASAICSSTLATALALINGPCWAPSSPAGATLRAFTAATRRLLNYSYTPFCTRKRLVHTQVWPLLRNFEPSAPCTAASRSASSKTIKGALRHQQFADAGGAGERQLLHVRVAGQLAADGARVGAGDDVQHACGNPGALAQCRQGQRRQRGFRSGLEHHGAAGGQGRADLAGDHGVGKVPRGDGRDHAD